MSEKTDKNPIMNSKITYKISTYPSKFVGYQAKKQENGTITLYISTMWKIAKRYLNEFDLFIEILTETMITERICIECAFQKLKINRCKPIKKDFYEFGCKMEYLTYLMVKEEE